MWHEKFGSLKKPYGFFNTLFPLKKDRIQCMSVLIFRIRFKNIVFVLPDLSTRIFIYFLYRLYILVITMLGLCMCLTGFVPSYNAFCFLKGVVSFMDVTLKSGSVDCRGWKWMHSKNLRKTI